MNVVSVLKSGGEFNPDHVRALKRQLPDLICLSDIEIRGVETVKLNNLFPGWWSKMNLFDPTQLNGDILYFDLDTVVLNSIDYLFNLDSSYALNDLIHEKPLQTGILYIKEEDKKPIFSDFIRRPQNMRKYHGDADFVRLHGNRFKRFQTDFPGKISSYKAHILKGKPLTDIICFHGKPRPWEVKADWIPDYGIQ